jgi:hypothetical protein
MSSWSFSAKHARHAKHAKGFFVGPARQPVRGRLPAREGKRISQDEKARSPEQEDFTGRREDEKSGGRNFKKTFLCLACLALEFQKLQSKERSV